jgi:tetratricopeptide (TPR) repeat protein
LRHQSFHLVQRAWAAYQAKRYDLAEKEARGALALEPNDAEALSVLSLCAMQRDDRAGAIQLAEQAVSRAADAAIYHYRLSRIHAYFGDHEAAEPPLRATLELDPRFAAAYYLYAWVYFARGQQDTALCVVDEALRINPLDVNSLNLRVEILRAKGDTSGALRTAHEALRVDPENQQTHALIGTLQLEIRHRESAIAHLKESLRIDPDTAWVRKAYSNALERQVLPARILLYVSRSILTIGVKGSPLVPVFFLLYLRSRQGFGVPTDWHPILLGLIIAVHLMVILAWWGPLLAYFAIPRDLPERRAILAEHGFWRRTRLGSSWQLFVSATILVSSASIFVPGDRVAPLACVTGGIAIALLTCMLANTPAAHLASRACAVAVCISGIAWFNDTGALQPRRKAGQGLLSKVFPVTVMLSVATIPTLNKPRYKWFSKK